MKFSLTDEPPRLFPCAQASDAEQWTPSTMFVVTDHLVQLLVKNLFRRQGTAGGLVPLLTPIHRPTLHHRFVVVGT